MKWNPLDRSRWLYCKENIVFGMCLLTCFILLCLVLVDVIGFPTFGFYMYFYYSLQYRPLKLYMSKKHGLNKMFNIL